jgi:uncharacterized repeat protein (TIGR01451 family)
MKSIRLMRFSISRSALLASWVVLLALLLLSIPAAPVLAQASTIGLAKSIDGGLTSVQTGQLIPYRIQFECSSLTGPCGTLEIDDVVPLGLSYEAALSSIPPGFTLTPLANTPTAGRTTLRLTKNDNNFLDGTQFDAVFVMRVNYDFRPLPATINNSASARNDPPGPGGFLTPVTANAPPVTVQGSTFQWEVRKVRVSPVIQPTVDTDVTYRVSLCPITPFGNTTILNTTLVDTLPAGAVFVDASDGGVYAPVPNTVTWPVIVSATPTACVDRFVTIRYPSSTFSIGQNVNNTVSGNGSYTDNSGGGVGPVGIPAIQPPADQLSPGIDTPTYSKDDVGDPVAINGTGRFVLSLSGVSTNIPVQGATLVDNLPPELRVLEVTTGTWDDPTVRAFVEYSTDNGSAWTAFPGQPVSNTPGATYAAPLTTITNVRWRFEYDPPGPTGFTPGIPFTFEFDTQPEVRVTPRSVAVVGPPALPAAVPGNTYNNCVQVARINQSGNPVTDPCNNETLTVVGNFVSVRTYKAETPGEGWDDLDDPLITNFVADGEIFAGDTLRYVVTLEITERSTASLVNPVIRDVLPSSGLIFVRNGTASFNGTVLPVQPTFTQSGLNLTWNFADASHSFAPVTFGSQFLTVEFFARVPRGQAPGAYTNNLTSIVGTTNAICESPSTQSTDTGDLDGDGNTTEFTCSNPDQFVVQRSAALRGQKWVRSNDPSLSTPVDASTLAPPTFSTCPNGGITGISGGGSNAFTRFPCVAQTYPSGALVNGQFTVPPPGSATLDDIEYSLRIFNDGNVAMTQYVLYDLLPRVGDRGSGGTLSNVNRESQFLIAMRGAIVFLSGPPGVTAANFTIEYSTVLNPCRPEVFNQPAGAAVPGGCANAAGTWSTTFSTSARAFRIRLTSGTIPPTPDVPIVFGVPMAIPNNSPIPDNAFVTEIGWNSFAHVAAYQDLSPTPQTILLLASEPRKVGVTIPEVMSIGNRVWRDSDNSGTINPPDDSNPGIAGVTVNLYRDVDGNGVPDGAAIASDTTDTNGYYLFSNLAVDSDPNNNRYIVGIPASNFIAGQPLENLRSSTGTPPNTIYTTAVVDGNADLNDHGRDPATLGQEVFSPTIQLTPDNEPVGEVPSGNVDHGPFGTGLNGESTTYSDLTVDFGFFGGTDIPFSIGNHVWLDNGQTAPGVFNYALRNDGIRNASEPPLANVRIELFRDGDNDGIADANEFILFDITDTGGFYLFDNLDPGNYFVVIPASNFAVGSPLAGLHSSQTTGTENAGVPGNSNIPATDSDDNGIDQRRPDLTGVQSGVIALVRGTAEVTGETHLSTDTGTGLGVNPTEDDGPNSRGRYGEPDENSNLTIDFGFIPPLSIGNRLWFDSGAITGSFNLDQYNNGIQDGAEPGVGAGVSLTLLRDNDNDTIFGETGEDVYTTTTDASGYYLFDGLEPGSYVVRVNSSSFGSGQPLLNYLSSTGNAADMTIDLNDNGIDNATPATGGILSNSFTLGYNAQPLQTPAPSATETDIPAVGVPYGPQSRGRFGEEDGDSNLTVDFGFIRAPRSVGNRVWFDVNNNGVLDSGELPAVGVRVSLYLDTDNNGVPDDIGIAGDATDNWVRFDTTDANGYYLFDRLPATRYIVGVDAVNFAAGQPLEEYASSVPTVNNSSNNLDNRDNGVDVLNPATSTYGVITNSINFIPAPLNAPTGESGSGNTTTTLGNNPTAGDGPQSRGRFGETDANSDLTIDFGFFKPMSIGNRVWRDDGTGGGVINDGLQNGSEPGIVNVRVELFAADASGVPTGPLLNFDTTDANGYYLFDRLAAGNYVVVIPASQFATSAALAGLNSSIPTGTEATAVTGSTATPVTDRDDNGINDFNPFTNGIRSGLIVLAVDTEPAGETDLSGQADPGAATNTTFSPTGWDGPNSRGRFGTSDDNSNLTVDFGFIPPMSIGNRVWLDNGSTVGGPVLTQFNDGIQNGNEAGIANVAVTLFRDNNTDGDYLDVGENIRTTTTDAAGYYLFDRLPPGNYIVRIDAGNFTTGQPLASLESSTGSSADEAIDLNDNGINTATYLTDGILSAPMTLAYGTEPTQTAGGETDIPATGFGPAGRGNFGEADTDSNLTMDFGFIVLPRSLGNRVWFDLDNSGSINAADGATPGAANVRVSLYQDTDNNGSPDDLGAAGPAGDALRFDTTDANGYYLFDNLLPGRYLVGVDAVNFTSGQPLFEYGSSIPTVNNASNDTDSLDNGINNANPSAAPYGILTANIDLSPAALAAPTGETGSGDTTTTLGNNPTAGDGPQSRGRFGESDTSSDLTIDFGFFKAMSIGNRVWLDNGAGGGVNNDGIQNGTEVGIATVTVELYRDNGNSTFEVGVDTLVTTDVTDANGYYLFEGLPQGNYFVRIAPSNFTGSNALAAYDSSTGNTGDTETDNNDNGIDDNFPTINGIVSPMITLENDGEPAAETPLSANVADGPNSRGNNNESDDNSDLTIDFGFVLPRYSLGNRVWYDTDNSGTINAGDDFDLVTAGDQPGIPNVNVLLYLDNGNGAFSLADTLVALDVTDANGYYLFETFNLQPGNPPMTVGTYWVIIDELEFRVPAGNPSGGNLNDFYSSNPQPANRPDNGLPPNDTVDNNDNGVYTNGDPARPAVANPEVLGVIGSTSGVPAVGVVISKNNEPVATTATGNAPNAPATESDFSNVTGDGPNSRGTLGQLDSNSNLTIDFGFYKPLSIGNRVWFDTDDSGTINGTETGVPLVVMELYLADASGNPTGAPIRTDVTDDDGFYLFDNLTPGNYVVVVAASNFTGTGALLGLASSTATNGDNGTDSDDNGQNTPIASGPGVGGIRSDQITLTRDGEVTTEASFSSNVADGANRIGTNGETNNNSDVTIDFGFVSGTMSLGNRVWLDPNDNGVIDTGETGIANVAVSLYRDNNNDGIPDGAAIRTQNTDANGYYLFEGLTPGRYVVGLNNANFAASAPLNGLVSTTGTSGVGSPVPTDSEIDSDATPANNQENGVDALNATYGLLSPSILLERDGETTAETDLGPQGNGTTATANNSELTIDFGLFRPMSIGNRVWFDPDNNGRINGAESGVAGVTVRLYRDNPVGATPGAFGADDFLDPRVEVTDGNGFYLFDRLGTGTYFVRVDPLNFQTGGVLIGTSSSTGAETTTTVDTTSPSAFSDNGVDDATPDVNGIVSNPIPLALTTLPTGETNLSANPADGPNSRGSNGETDNNSNLTIDFGFVNGQMSLGNRIWFDVDRDGIRQDTESGVPAGVNISLYRDSNSDGVPDGTAIATTTTDPNGYYLFNNLTPGNYIVGVDASNFTGTRPLVGYGSTVTQPADVDNNDNGVDTVNPAVTGVLSGTIVLVQNNEPTGELDLGTAGTGGPTDNNSNLTVDMGFYRPLSLGNRVWFDPNNNGIMEGTEVGIAGVTLRLWLDDGDGVFNPATDVNTGLTDTTDARGYYLFSDLRPGNYFVQVEAANFTGVLSGSTSSAVDDTATTTDRTDNGQGTTPTADGIISNLITLTETTQPVNETDTSGDATNDGPFFRGTDGESDNNSNLTIDFGFNAPTLSVGNRVWRDDNNNGLLDGSEVGVDGVVVGLYTSDAAGNPVGPALRTDTTANGGYYLFEGVPPGAYVIRVEASNFQTGGPLAGLSSSTGADTTETNDSNGTSFSDNGIDGSNVGTSGVLSNRIVLASGTEPDTETDLETGVGDGNGVPANSSNLTIDFGFVARFDRADNPDSYGTTIAATGPAHQIIANLYLGSRVDSEDDGQPSVGADGDDVNGTPDDEDGIPFFPPMVVGAAVPVDVTVFNNTGSPANMVAWIDFNGNGTFEASEAAWRDTNSNGVLDGSESNIVVVPSAGSPQVVSITFLVPIGSDIATGGDTYARIRLTNDPLTNTQTGGTVNSGEVEDYLITNVQPPGVVVTKSDGQNSIVVGQSTTYTIIISNSSVDALNLSVVDNPPTTAPNGFDPATLTWSCAVTRGAGSCVASLPAGTTANGTGSINTAIDLPRDSTVVFTYTGTLRATHSDPTVTNEVLVGPDDRAQDVNGVIFDPPAGVKTGVHLGGNIIRWTMVWQNTGGRQAANVSDTLQPGQTFLGNLTCSAIGISTTTTCEYLAGSNTVTWTGEIDTGLANRVEIAFDVRVAGDGTYTNTGTISVGTDTLVATGRVTIGNPPTDGGGDPGPGGDPPPPLTLTKVGLPAFVQPGDEVTWTITVSNPNATAVNDVVVTDSVPGELEVLSVTSDRGQVSVDGQNIRFTLGTLNPNENATITIRSRVREEVEAMVIVNTADMSGSKATAQVTVVGSLPATGEEPLWASILRWGAILGGLALLLIVGAAFRKVRT